MLPPVTVSSLSMPEVVDEQSLGLDHVGDGDHGERQPVGLAGARVDRRRAGAAAAAADDVRADDEVLVGVERLAGADGFVPPAGLRVARGVLPGDVRVAGQRVENQDRVALVRVELAVGFVGERDRPERRAALQLQLVLERADIGF